MMVKDIKPLVFRRKGPNTGEYLAFRETGGCGVSNKWSDSGASNTDGGSLESPMFAKALTCLPLPEEQYYEDGFSLPSKPRWVLLQDGIWLGALQAEGLAVGIRLQFHNTGVQEEMMLSNQQPIWLMWVLPSSQVQCQLLQRSLLYFTRLLCAEFGENFLLALS